MKPILSRSGFGCGVGTRDGVFGPAPEWKAGRRKGKSSNDTYIQSLRDQVPCKSICKVTVMKADVVGSWMKIVNEVKRRTGRSYAVVTQYHRLS